MRRFSTTIAFWLVFFALAAQPAMAAVQHMSG
jgi:hypothetical protein